MCQPRMGSTSSCPKRWPPPPSTGCCTTHTSAKPAETPCDWPKPSTGKESNPWPDTNSHEWRPHPHGQIHVRHWAVLIGHQRAVPTSANGQLPMSIDRSTPHFHYTCPRSILPFSSGVGLSANSPVNAGKGTG